MASQIMWRLSESTTLQWRPRYFNETVNRALESIGTEFPDAKGTTTPLRLSANLAIIRQRSRTNVLFPSEKLKTALRALLAAVKDLNDRIDATDGCIS